MNFSAKVQVSKRIVVHLLIKQKNRSQKNLLKLLWCESATMHTKKTNENLILVMFAKCVKEQLSSNFQMRILTKRMFIYTSTKIICSDLGVQKNMTAGV